MDTAEREEVKVIVHEVTVGSLARIEASLNLVEFRLTSMDDHMKVANGNTAKNVLKIAQVEKEVDKVKQEIKNHEVKCPQSDTLDNIKELVGVLNLDKVSRDKLAALMDTQEEKDRKVKEEKRAKFMKVVETVGVVIAALALLANLLFSTRAYQKGVTGSGGNSEVQTTTTIEDLGYE